MWVTASRTAILSIITGGGKWVEMAIPADALYQHLLLTAEKKFWRCVETGETPHLFGIEPPKPRIEAIRTVDMSGSNAWAEFANLYRLTSPPRSIATGRRASSRHLCQRMPGRPQATGGAGQAIQIGRDQFRPS